jgi:hypothetical protein
VRHFRPGTGPGRHARGDTPGTGPLPHRRLTGAPPEQIGTPDRAQETCLRLDKNHDGDVTRSEFKAAKLAGKAFTSADANHDRRLDIKECDQAPQGP